MTGPLAEIRVLELGGIGPVPFTTMVLKDMGAGVVKVERVVAVTDQSATDLEMRHLDRGKRSIAVDLTAEDAHEVIRRIVCSMDVLVEGFRPGVAERLRVGPDVCLEWNPRLVYARMTGWGESGPLRDRGGHDLNYLALSGLMKPDVEAPDYPPSLALFGDFGLHVMGDFGAGGLGLATTILAALVHRQTSDEGQVVSYSLLGGAALLAGPLCSIRATPSTAASAYAMDAPFYGLYETADGGFMSVAAFESKFYAELLRVLDLDELLGSQGDRGTWPAARAEIAARFRAHTRDHWADLFLGIDACVAPVLSLDDAAAHPQLQANDYYVTEPSVQPGRVFGFERSGSGPVSADSSPARGEHTAEILAEAGFEEPAIRELVAAGVVG